MCEYLPESESSEGRVKVELDLSYYATKAGLENAKMLIHQNLLKRLI